MAVVLVILGVFCVWLLIRYINMILAVRSLHMQLNELERGSHMDLGVTGRQRDVRALGRKLNQLKKRWSKDQMQYVQLAQECTDDLKREYYLETAGGRLRELGDMLEEMFLYTKLTSAGFEFRPSEIQVFPILSECLVGLYRQFEERGVSPDVEFQSESLRVWADAECLRRIFHNLIQNALVHGRGGIVIRQTERCISFENLVSETSRPDPEQIFDQFYKADSARRKGSSGLGLFIVKELAEKMGGSVKAEFEGEKLRITLEIGELWEGTEE